MRARSVAARKEARTANPAVRSALVAAVLGFVWLAYANSFHALLLLDNNWIILHDPRVHAATPVALHRILTEQYWPTANNGLYRPLSTLSYLFDYAILGNGADPFGYHAINFLLHAVNVVLVYLLGVELFQRKAAALALSAFWGVHPVLTESVTNVVGRADLLAAFGVLAALLCHRRAMESTGARRTAWLAAIALAVAIGVFSKESGIVVLGALAVYDFTVVRKVPWKTRLASYAAAAIPCLLFLYIRYRVLSGASYQATSFAENPLLGTDFWTARMTAFKIFGKYLWLLLFPLHLSWDYSYNAVPLFRWSPARWEDLKTIASVVGAIAIAAAALRFRRAHLPFFFAVAFFFVTISPTSNFLLLIGAIMAERFLYLPSIGFAILAIWAVDALWRRMPAAHKAIQYGGVAILLAFAARTYARNADWLDEQRFWLGAAEAGSDSYKVNMAVTANTTAASDADLARSLHYAERALAILHGLPDSRDASDAYPAAGTFFETLGDRAAARGSHDEAQSWYRRALDMQLKAERIAVAFDKDYQAENARRGRPGLTSLSAQTYLDLGRAYLKLGDTAQALAAFERGRELESSPEVLDELAKLYQSEGDPRKAVQALVEALAVDSKRTDLIPRIADLYGQIDPNGCAVSREGGGVSLNSDCPLVHGDICSASRNVIASYVRRGQTYEADAIRKIAERDIGCAAGTLK